MTRQAFMREMVRPFAAIMLAYLLVAQLMVAGAANGRLAAADDFASFPICYGAGAPADTPDAPLDRPANPLDCALCTAAMCPVALDPAAPGDISPPDRFLAEEPHTAETSWVSAPEKDGNPPRAPPIAV